MIHPILIVGAGPAGLKLSHELRKLGKEHLLIDRADVVGSSWRDMPVSTQLQSPWSWNFLNTEDKRRFDAGKFSTSREYHQYLLEYEATHQLQVLKNCEVRKISCSENIYSLETSQGTFQAEKLVLATGYFGNPVYPDFYNAAVGIRQIHYADFTLQSVEGLRKILIIGKRLSSGQLLDILAPKHDLYLSVRSTITYGLEHRFLVLLSPLLYLLEKVFASIKPKMELPVPMPAKAKALLSSGQIKVVPEVSALEGKAVRFKDGSELEIDAIIYATGFRPCTLEVSTSANLYHLGNSEKLSFRSRFLRGIRDDARRLAARL